MRDKTRRLSTKVAVAAVAALCIPAFAATGAASAAQWAELTSPAYAHAGFQGTLSVQVGYYIPGINPPVSCPINIPTQAGLVNNMSGFALFGEGTTTCQNGRNFKISLTSAGSSPATALAIDAPGGSFAAPVAGTSSTYEQQAFTVPLVNGTGGTKTKIVFNNTQIAKTYTGTRPTIHVTGNLEIISPTGGTYTRIP